MIAATIGQKVKITETHRGLTWTKFGEVVELNGERVRVRWSHWLYPDGFERPDGKRTWFAIKRLQNA